MVNGWGDLEEENWIERVVTDIIVHLVSKRITLGLGGRYSVVLD